jgi:hypothetical protein
MRTRARLACVRVAVTSWVLISQCDAWCAAKQGDSVGIIGGVDDSVSASVALISYLHNATQVTVSSGGHELLAWSSCACSADALQCRCVAGSVVTVQHCGLSHAAVSRPPVALPGCPSDALELPCGVAYHRTVAVAAALSLRCHETAACAAVSAARSPVTTATLLWEP